MFVSIRINRVFLIAAAAAVLAAVSIPVVALSAQDRAEQNTEIRLPILMYHSILKEPKRQGKYTVSPSTLENDMKYLQKNGYQTVSVQDLVDYVHGRNTLPEKPVMLTFDDGYYNNYVYAYPLAKKYRMKLVISPVGYYTDQFTESDWDHPNYSYLTWGEISEMMASGLVEFQNHSYNLHSVKGRAGAQKRKYESNSAYRAMLLNDLSRMQREMQEKTGYTPTAFVYPFGAYSPESVPVLKEMGFQASMTCQSKINTITKDPECLFSLGRFLRPSGTSSWVYFQKIGLGSASG